MRKRYGYLLEDAIVNLIALFIVCLFPLMQYQETRIEYSKHVWNLVNVCTPGDG